MKQTNDVITGCSVRKHELIQERVKLKRNFRKVLLIAREDLRDLIFEIAKDYGGAVLHYNEKIDQIFLKINKSILEVEDVE